MNEDVKAVTRVQTPEDAVDALNERGQVRVPPTRRCKHQTSPIPCPVPSCPAGTARSVLKMTIGMRDGSVRVMKYRRALGEEGGWKWHAID